MSRERNLTSFIEAQEERADAILEDFVQFTSGTRVLLLLLRHKEGGHNKESKRRRAREVVHSLEQMKKALVKLLILKATSGDGDYRIYMSSAPRDLRKAEMQFKNDMLQVDFAEGENKRYFWENLEEKWISALMGSNPMRGEGRFVVDIDAPINDAALKWLEENKVRIYKSYQTKNGWHIVVEPFNQTLFPKEIGEVKKDGLLLLDY